VTVVGPRQVGKTTLVQQVTEAFGLATCFASADDPTLRGASWIEQQWEAARLSAEDGGRRGAVLVLDEVQKLDRLERVSEAPVGRRHALPPAPQGDAARLRAPPR
jgi:predicted AAA+ superfamily ATPase